MLPLEMTPHEDMTVVRSPCFALFGQPQALHCNLNLIDALR